MSFIITAAGTDHHIDGIAANDPMPLATIAHSLAQINRFNGHCVRPYSVAEHSLLVADLAREAGASVIVQFAALMHDAHEAVVGDVSSPVKWALGHEWGELEELHARQMRQQYGLLATFAGYSKAIKQWDLIALATERRDLMYFNPAQNRLWPILDTPGAEIRPSATHHISVGSQSWHEWSDEWLRVAATWKARIAEKQQAIQQAPQST